MISRCDRRIVIRERAALSGFLLYRSIMEATNSVGSPKSIDAYAHAGSTVGFVHGYREHERDGLGKPVLDLSRVRSKVHRVIGGQDEGSSDESVESECDA